MNIEDFKAGIRPATHCWTCRHSHFNKRQGTIMGRGRGHCLFLSGAPPFKRSWTPPELFWRDVEDGEFRSDYQEWLSHNAGTYWPEKLALERQIQGQLHITSDELHREHAYMCWLADHLHRIVQVSWQDTCDHYQPYKGDEADERETGLRGPEHL